MPDKQNTRITHKTASMLAFGLTLLLMLGTVCVVLVPTGLKYSELTEIETQIQTHPRKALVRLESLSGYESGTLRGRKAWLQVCAMEKLGLPFASDSLYQEALEYSPSEKMLPHLHTCMGDYYVQHRRYNEAIDHYAQAYMLRKTADETDTSLPGAYAELLRVMRSHKKQTGVSEAQLRAELDVLLREAELKEAQRRTKEVEEGWSELLGLVLVVGLFSLFLGEWRNRRRFGRLYRLLFSQADHIQTTDTEASAARLQLEQHRSLLLQREQQLRNSLAELQQSQQQGEEQRLQMRQMEDKLLRMQDELFASNPVVSKVRELSVLDAKQRTKAHKTYALDQNERASLYEAVDLRYDNFVSWMQSSYPLLNADDLLICVLLRMDVPHADVAFLLSCSEEALKKRKFRIKKEKLMLPSDGKPLDEVLHHIGSPEVMKED